MFTATPIEREKDEKGRLVITVSFSDGVETFVDKVIPGDEDGFHYFIKERLSSLNTAKQLETSDILNKPVVFPEIPNEITPEKEYQLARLKLSELKIDVDLGLATQDEFDIEKAKVIALKPR